MCRKNELKVTYSDFEFSFARICFEFLFEFNSIFHPHRCFQVKLLSSTASVSIFYTENQLHLISHVIGHKILSFALINLWKWKNCNLVMQFRTAMEAIKMTWKLIWINVFYKTYTIKWNKLREETQHSIGKWNLQI